MKIVIDTNVLISGIFFGGIPGKVLSAVIRGNITACSNAKIIAEYRQVIDEMVSRKQGHINTSILNPLILQMELIESKTKIKLCRDPEDDKFLECAKDAKALYIVSGDNDLLVLKKFEDIEIITAKEFYDRYLSKK